MVCDCGSSNRRVFKLLKITEGKLHLEMFVRKIWFNHDAPHFIKCLRNNFRKYEFHSEGQFVCWGILRKLRDRDRKYLS